MDSYAAWNSGKNPGQGLGGKIWGDNQPALVLLNSTGQVIRTDARNRLAAGDPDGLEFPWPAPAGGQRRNPVVNLQWAPQ